MKHVMTFRTKAKAERVIELGAKTHIMKWRKAYQYDEDGALRPIYYIWYTQR